MENNEIIENLKILMTVEGISDVDRALKSVGLSEKYLIDNSEKLIKIYGGLGNAVNVLSKKIKDKQALEIAGNKKVIDSLKQMANGYGLVGNVASEASRAVKSIIFPSSFGAAIKYSVDLQKGFLQASASSRVFGISMGNLQRDISNLSKSTYLLKDQITGIFEQYQSTATFPSLKQFDNLMLRSKDVVGSNKEAISDMVNVISKLTVLYPEVGNSIANLNKRNPDYLIKQQEALKQLNALWQIGEISQAEYMKAKSFVRGTSTLGESEKEGQKATEMSQNFQKAWANAMESMGNQLLPWLIKASDFLKRFNEWMDRINISVGQLAIVISGAKTGFSLLGIAAKSIMSKVFSDISSMAMSMGKTIGETLSSSFSSILKSPKLAAMGALKGGAGLLASFGYLKLGKEIKNSYGGMDLAKKRGYGADLAKESFLGSKFLGGLISGSGISKNTREIEDKNKEIDKKIAISKIKRDAERESEAAVKESSSSLVQQDGLEAELIQKRRISLEMIKKMGELYSSQSNVMRELVTRMGMVGEIDTKSLSDNFKTQVETLTTIQTKAQEALDTFGNRDMSDKNLIADMKRVGVLDKISEEAQKALDGGKFEQANQLVINDLKTKVLSTERQIYEAQKNVTSVYDDQLSYLQSIASQTSSVVNLANNYAVGVRASASLVMAEYDAQENIINVLKEKYALQQKTAEDARREGKDNIKIRKDMVDTENAILQAQQSQASSVKSMRDGWVSALTAMNTGAGAFTEIIMDSTQNTAQIMKLQGAVRSGKSGAIAGRDVYGNIVENVGYRGSSRINAQGQITSRGGQGLGEAAYLTPIEEMMGVGNFSKVVEAGMRGKALAAAQRTTAMSAVVRSGGGTAVGPGETNKSAYLGDNFVSEASKSATPEVNISFDNIKISIENIGGINELSSRLSGAIQSKVEKAMEEVTGMFGKTGSYSR